MRKPRMTREQYLLICLMEEAGEVIQAAAKCLRHGKDNYDPARPKDDNWSDLKKEVTDFRAVSDLLAELNGEDVLHNYSDGQYEAKQERIENFMKERP